MLKIKIYVKKFAVCYLRIVVHICSAHALCCFDKFLSRKKLECRAETSNWTENSLPSKTFWAEENFPHKRMKRNLKLHYSSFFFPAKYGLLSRNENCLDDQNNNYIIYSKIMNNDLFPIETEPQNQVSFPSAP